jgi:hypothetical protein
MALSGECLEIADDAGGAFGGVVNRVKIAPGLFVEIPRGQALGTSQDGGQRIVQLVRDAGHRLAE